MISPILWKEWREQRWKLAFGTLMLVFFTGSFLAARVGTNQEMAVVIGVFGGLILALHSAMGVFAPERANGTMSFLASKPIEPWKVFACKWLFGWLNVAGPMLACTLALILFRPGDTAMTGLRTQMVIRMAIGGLGLATMFYTMTCCLAPRRAGEAYVGLIGLFVILGMILHGLIVIDAMANAAIQAHTPLYFFKQTILYVNPIVWISLIDRFPNQEGYGLLVLVQIIVFAITVWIGFRKWKRSM